jgi:predicted dehydrogenase
MTSLDALIKRDDVDAIAITTPSGLHAGMTVAALRAGKDVLVEKPLAVTLDDADLVISEADRLHRLVAVVSQRRFEPAVEALHSAIQAGALGRLCLVSARSLNFRDQAYYDRAAWRGTHAMDGGVLKNQAIHEIDLLCWLGGPVRSVAAHVATLGHVMEAEDSATSGFRARAQCSWRRGACPPRG